MSYESRVAKVTGRTGRFSVAVPDCGSPFAALPAGLLIKSQVRAVRCAPSTPLHPSSAARNRLGPDTNPRARWREAAVVVRGLSLAGRRRLIQLGPPAAPCRACTACSQRIRNEDIVRWP